MTVMKLTKLALMVLAFLLSSADADVVVVFDASTAFVNVVVDVDVNVGT